MEPEYKKTTTTKPPYEHLAKTQKMFLTNIICLLKQTIT